MDEALFPSGFLLYGNFFLFLVFLFIYFEFHLDFDSAHVIFFVFVLFVGLWFLIVDSYSYANFMG